MKYAYVMIKTFPTKRWSIGDTYESLRWQEPTEEKPLDASMQEYWVDLKNEYHLDDLRKLRDALLTKTDKYGIVDWPFTAEKRDEWFVYRQALRDLPGLYLEKMGGEYTISGEVIDVSGTAYNFFPSIV